MKKKTLYLANQLGFSKEVLKPSLDALLPWLERRFKVYEPFRDGGLITDPDSFEKAMVMNSKAIRKAKVMAAVLDGSADVESGTAGEMGRYIVLKKGPIIALRTDIRTHAPGMDINPELERYIEKSGGRLCKNIRDWHYFLEKFANGTYHY